MVPPVDGTYSGSLAVVALEACPAPDDGGMAMICRLRQEGFRVLCYADGVLSWPLSVRCRLFVAGARWLLDSASAEFAHALQHLLDQVRQADLRQQAEEARVKHALRQVGGVGESPAMLAVFQTVCRVSPLSDLPILLTGETGTGKELLARAIHRLDPKRCQGPFVPLNCSAISPSLAESELFGHRRGAFTGAERERPGVIRAAEGGILFLDEIGDLDPALQGKLLRVLQEHRVLGLGADREVAVNVRILAATHRPLEAMVHQGTFRADLLHRLQTLTIHIPPLRERSADLPPLLAHFLAQHRALRPQGPLAVDPEVSAALAQLPLPGNAREVENLVRWALVHKDDDTPLTLRDLPPAIWQQVAELESCAQGQATPAQVCQDHPPAALAIPSEPLPAVVGLLERHGWNLAQALEHCEQLMLEAARQRAHGNQAGMARLLGVTPRSIYNKLHKHHLQG